MGEERTGGFRALKQAYAIRTAEPTAAQRGVNNPKGAIAMRLSRRGALGTGAAAAALPLVRIGTAGAA